MVKAKVSQLLMDLISERVQVVTTMKQIAALETGKHVEVPFMVEGKLIDFDEQFLLVGTEGTDYTELVSRSHVISVKIVDMMEEVMYDRPHDDELN